MRRLRLGKVEPLQSRIQRSPLRVERTCGAWRDGVLVWFLASCNPFDVHDLPRPPGPCAAAHASAAPFASALFFKLAVVVVRRFFLIGLRPCLALRVQLTAFAFRPV